MTSIDPEHHDGQDIASKLDRTLKRLVVATAVLYIVLIGVGYYTYTVVTKNTDGLCSIRRDAETRAIQLQAFINDHPRGTQQTPAVELQRNLKSAQNLAKALENIKCPPPPRLIIKGG